MFLDLFWLLDIFLDLFYAFGFILVVEFIYFDTYDLFYVAHLPYFAISYDVEFDNLIIILFFTN